MPHGLEGQARIAIRESVNRGFTDWHGLGADLHGRAGEMPEHGRARTRIRAQSAHNFDSTCAIWGAWVHTCTLIYANGWPLWAPRVAHGYTGRVILPSTAERVLNPVPSAGARPRAQSAIRANPHESARIRANPCATSCVTRR